MLRFLRCYYLHFTRHSELLRGSLAQVVRSLEALGDRLVIAGRIHIDYAVISRHLDAGDQLRVLLYQAFATQIDPAREYVLAMPRRQQYGVAALASMVGHDYGLIAAIFKIGDEHVELVRREQGLVGEANKDGVAVLLQGAEAGSYRGHLPVLVVGIDDWAYC